MDVVIDVKKRVVLPVSPVPAEDYALPESPEFQEALVEKAFKARDGNRLFENQYRRDHHGILGALHPQPGPVNGGHLRFISGNVLISHTCSLSVVILLNHRVDGYDKGKV